MDGNRTEERPQSAEALKQWSLSRIDIRSPVASSAWPVARVELVHPERGRVTDIASAPGAFDAAFLAAGQILGIAPRLVSYDVHSAGAGADGALVIRIEVELEVDGRCYRGSSLGVDLVRASLAAWLEAACRSLGGGGDAVRNRPARPYHVSGVDENGDLWIFASEDAGARDAIADEFRKEGYGDVLLHPPAE